MLTVPGARDLLLTRDELDGRGWGSRRIRAALDGGALRRVHAGRYVESAAWAQAWPEERHLLEVVAASDLMRGGDAVFSHTAAAVLHGLPLLAAPDRVHLSGATAGGHVRRDPGMARHEVDVPDADITEVAGIRCTGVARTVADLCRALRPEPAVAVADAAFGRAAWHPDAGGYDEVAHAAFLDAVRSRMERVAAARGVRQGRQVLELADGRAESPGESLNRLQLLRAGFRRIRLQVPVPGPLGRDYRVDASVDDVPVWIEFDGARKYTDDRLRGGRSLESVLLREKRREEWIRAMTDTRLVRYGSDVIRTTRTLEHHLAALGIRPPAPGPRTGILRATR